MVLFHGLLLTKDDDDIIEECITHALTWCDYLYIYDTGSIDSTLERIKALTSSDHRILLLEASKGPVQMESGLRGYLFNSFRWNINPGDWVVQVDSDEFYHISPKKFVQENLNSHETGLFNLTYEFRLTTQEALEWYQSPDLTSNGNSITQSRRYYNVLDHSEPRAFQYRKSMKWPPYIAYPYYSAYFSSSRIPVRHYPQRNPLQLQRRWALRHILAPLADPNWSHWHLSDWRDLLANASDNDLCFWSHGSELPIMPRSVNHYSQSKHYLKIILHQLGLVGALDRLKEGQASDYEPTLLPSTINARISAAYRLINSASCEHTMDAGLLPSLTV